MAIIAKPYTFSPGTVIRSAQVNADLDTIYGDYNGNITNANISNSAAIAWSKISATSGSPFNFSDNLVGDVFLNLFNTHINGPTGLQVGSGGSGNRASYIDIVGDDTYTDYGLRIIRQGTGANANSSIFHKGTGGLEIKTENAGAIGLFTNNVLRILIDPAGNLTFNSLSTMESNGELLLPAVNPPAANAANRHSIVKAWCKFNTGAVSPAVLAQSASYNVTSVTRNPIGQINIAWTTPFSSANYVPGWSGNSNTTSNFGNQLAGSINFFNFANNTDYYIFAYGDQ